VSRISEFRDVISGSRTEPLSPGHPQDRALLSLLVHTAFADGQVAEEEFDLLGKLAPDKDMGELLIWIAEEAEKTMNIAELAHLFPAPTDRHALLELVQLMVGMDGVETSTESTFLDMLRSALA
jgi:uncharacterized membrane protein YebE (DUF533 family)